MHGRGWQTENFARGSNPLVLEMSFLVKMQGSNNTKQAFGPGVC